MANKKKIEQRQQAVRKKNTERTIQIAGGVIAALLVVGILWLVLPSKGADQPACERFADIPRSAQYGEPPLRIDTGKQYSATVKMEKGGQFAIQLYPDKAPKTVNSFVFLTCKGYFNGVTFHRVIEGFMAQGGDPTGTGVGGPGYEFEYEANDLLFDKPGVVAMANNGARTPTNGGQFFITFVPYPSLDGGYTIFGQVIEGMDVVNSITRRDPQQNPSFEGDKIASVTITEQ